MRPKDVTETLCALLSPSRRTRRPIYLWGAPGVGKSSIVAQAGETLGMKVLDLRAVLLDPVDLRGLPMIDRTNNTVRWAPPAFLPLKGAVDGPGIIFADELAQAAPLVQAAFLQGVLDHRIGETELDPSWVWVAASNRQEDRAGAHKVITPLLNRFCHLDLEVSNEDWLDWALQAGVAAEVRSFIQWKGALLFDFDPASGKRAFCTPRSWQFVSDNIEGTPPHLLHKIVSGCVGEGPAAEFAAFVQIYRDLPDPEAVLAAPTTHPVPKEPSVLFALVGALTDRLRNADRAKLGAFVSYATRLPGEFAVMGFRDGQAVNDKLIMAPGASAWMLKNKQMLIKG